jgi:hypothetical protein
MGLIVDSSFPLPSTKNSLGIVITQKKSENDDVSLN